MRNKRVIYSEKAFLLPIFLFFILFSLASVSAFPVNSQGIYYNYTHPNGVLGNAHLVWNDGTGSSGVVQNGTTIQNLNSQDLIDYSLSGEVTPIGLQNGFDVNDGTKTALINTNGVMFNNSYSFSYFTWVKRNTPLTQYTASYYVNPLLSSFANTTGDLYLNFYLFSSTYHNLEQASSPALTFEMGYVNQNNGVFCQNSVNYTMFRDTNKYHLIGFVYNYSNILSGDLVQLYYDGVMVKNCSTQSLSGSAVSSKLKTLVIGAMPLNVNGSNTLWYPANQKLVNTGLYSYALDNSTIQTLNSSSYFNGTQPILFNAFDDIYDVTNHSVTLNLSDHFTTNYDSVLVHYPDTYLNGTIFHVNLVKLTSNTTAISNNYSVNMTLWSDGYYQYLRMDKGLQHFASQVTITASNSYGNSSDYFALYYYTPGSYSNGSLLNNTTNTFTSTIFGGIISFFNSFFPDPSGLDSGQKIAYIIITLIVVTAIILIGGSYLGAEAEILITASLFFDVLFFVYFIIRGYMSVGVVLLLVLLGIIASFLKFKTSSGVK